MSIGIKYGKSDRVLEQIVEALRAYETDHPQAKIDLFRRDPYSIRVRIINPGFAGQEEMDRYKSVWPYLDELPEEVESDITMLVLVTEAERKSSFTSMQFDDPTLAEL